MINLKDSSETLKFGSSLFEAIDGACVIYLDGELGAGKTTLVRGFLQQAGFTGTVKSPTFTLVEEYNIGTLRVAHFDLYRLEDPEELEWIGVRDYFGDNVVWFIEWPQKGQGFLPQFDLSITLQIDPSGRTLKVDALTGTGNSIKDRLNNQL